MATVVGIRFRPAGRIYYFNPAGLALAVGSYAIVETARGTEAGRVVIGMRQVLESELTEPLKAVLRQATDDDLRQMLSYKSQEKEALSRCLNRVSHHQLPMKLVEAEYTYDGSKLTFYFIAEQRVDFRVLVRDLAATFRTRIELRQIGARDHAKLTNGIGPCGKSLCCSTWLGEFGVVSIKMAKDQGLPLNPSKISGVCGRLLCCLQYEETQYVEAKQSLPAIGDLVTTAIGEGKVINLNVPKEAVEVELLQSGAIISVHSNNLKRSRPSIGGGSLGGPAKEVRRSACSTGGSGGCGSGGCGSCGSGGGGCGSCGVKKKKPAATSFEAMIPGSSVI